MRTSIHISHRWADQCNFEHDHNRIVPDFKSYPYVGQNIYMGLGSSFDDLQTILTSGVQAWYDEVLI